MRPSPNKKARRAGARTGHRYVIAPQDRVDWLWGAFLVAATILAYQSVWQAGYVWDDDVYVTANKLLTAPDGLRRIWFSLDSPSQYFPLVYTTFRIEHALWGMNPAGYHWVNILLHSANALLVWRLLRRLRVPGAWLAAAIFALHPVEVESVAWITERKNVLMGFFFLLALLSGVEFLEEQSRRMWKFYALALIFYALALFSKTTACTLPAALLLILWLKKEPIDWRRLAQIAPFVALGIGMGLVTVWWERYHQGTQGKLFAIGLPERLLAACRALWFYAGKLLWPAELTFSYPRWTISAANPLDYGWLFATATLGVAIYFVRRRVGRSIEVATLFFAATLSPMLGFIMLYTFRFSFVADHYQYLASIGPIALAAACIARLEVFKSGRPWLGATLCAALLLTLGTLTWRQGQTYRSTETLWSDTLDKNPNSWMAHSNLGTALLRLGRVDEAIVHYNKALEIDPNYATGHNNLGNAFLRIGQLEESLAHLQKALAIDPTYPEAHNNLGNTLLQMGRVDEAIAHYNKAVEIDPKYVEAHNNLGAVFLQIGRREESLAHLQKALEIDPENGEAHNNLGNTFLRIGRVDEAIAHYSKALEINPLNVNAQNNMAWLLATSPEARLRNGPKAVELAERADHLAGNQSPVIGATLAAAYAETGRFSDAVKTARRALQLATGQGNRILADAIREQIELYQSGSPSRDNGQTSVPANATQP
jgi:protein O-mannosyl-transferase